jgi:hypothetical protein
LADPDVKPPPSWHVLTPFHAVPRAGWDAPTRRIA